MILVDVKLSNKDNDDIHMDMINNGKHNGKLQFCQVLGCV